MRSAEISLLAIGGIYGLGLSHLGWAASSAFEVASVKPSPPEAGLLATNPAWGDVDGRVVLRHIQLKTVMLKAYGLQRDQLRGPAWLEDKYFDILANAPAGAPKSAIPQMLRNLLIERFGIKSHTERVVASVKALVVAPGGERLLRPAANSAPGKTKQGGGAKPIVQAEGIRERDSARITGRSTGGAFGPFRLTLEKETMVLHYQFESITMNELAQFLSEGPLETLVVDATQLKGAYTVEVEQSPRLSAATMASLPDAERAKEAEAHAPDPVGIIVTSLRKAGLRLEDRKMPRQRLVIDSIRTRRCRTRGLSRGPYRRRHPLHGKAVPFGPTDRHPNTGYNAIRTQSVASSARRDSLPSPLPAG